MSTELHTERVENIAALRALAPEWDELWRNASRATPFQSSAWLIPWWESFAPGTLNTITVRSSGGKLVGIAPLYLETGAQGTRLLPIGVPISDYLDILLDPAHDAAAAKAIMADLAAQKGWSSLELPELLEDAAALSLPCPDRFESVVEQQSSVCPFLPLPGDVAGLEQIFPARKRRSLRMIANRAARRGAVRVLSLADLDTQAMLSHFYRLHRLRWESRGQHGALADERVQHFHRLAAPKLVEAGVLRAFALQIGADIAAIYYGFQHRDRAYGYLTGLDPAFEFESPGTLIVAHAIEQAVREGARVFDFLRGGETYKYQWGARDRWNMRRVIQRIAVHAEAG